MPLNAIAYAIMKSMNNLRFGEEDYNNNDNLFRIPTSPKCFSVGSCKIDAQYSNNTIQCDTIRYDTTRYDTISYYFYFHVLVFYTGYFIKEIENIFPVFPYVIETRVKVWKNSKLRGNNRRPTRPISISHSPNFHSCFPTRKMFSIS